VVVEDAVDDVGDGLEASVRVPGRALGLPGRVLHLAHLVHHDERVELGQVDAGEGTADGEALALVAGGRGADLPHRARLVTESGLTQAGQDGQVWNSDCGHLPTSSGHPAQR
jgi:hypothetical protein